jgi:hypothetical protein
VDKKAKQMAWFGNKENIDVTPVTFALKKLL